MAKENIYDFKVSRFEKKQVETKRKNKNGEEETVTTEKKVKVPVTFFLKSGSCIVLRILSSAC